MHYTSPLSYWNRKTRSSNNTNSKWSGSSNYG